MLSEKEGSIILTKIVLDDISRRLDCMAEICANSLDDKSSVELRREKFEKIKTKYADLN
jgi:hypothetical protein